MAVIASYIGLPKKDTNLLKSLFEMLKGSSRTPIDITFVDFNDYVMNEQMPDILFVNKDLPKAMELWAKIETNFPLIVGVFVTNDGSSGAQSGHYQLTRPISLRQVLSTLQVITNLNTANNGSMDFEHEICTSHKLNVLVVDDSFPVRKYMDYTLPRLTSEKIKLEYAADGHEAIAMTAVNHYGLIFLDVVMPGLDGYKVCKFIKKRHRSYIVMLTSKKSPFDKVRGTMSGCDAYVVKPPKEQRLEKILRTCLAKTSSSYLHTKDGLTYKY